ncbi:hypothetical protein MsAg5_02370 [Methanosarcinaceae archaeon Ag5]|uniref:Uncharacterized protein n=1 Tax=Methanolapillus africanus TaxID=3028297 RepID=A0AAE4MI73_9EURY|nr:hypothetical protein [Methanosarcinaceae archaeon Ag5]
MNMTEIKKKYIHIMCAGNALPTTYREAQKEYPIHRVVIFNDSTFKNKNEDIEKNILETMDLCKGNRIEVERVDLGKITIDDVMAEFLKIYSKYNDYKFMFNITPGAKPLALCLFYASIWIEGDCYYISEGKKDTAPEILKFERPQIHLKEIEKNPNYVTILSFLNEKKDKEADMQEILRYIGYKHGDKIVEGQYQPVKSGDKTKRYVSIKMITDWTKNLELWGLVTKENIDGRTKKVCLTRDGRFTINFLKNTNNKEEK